MTYLYLDTVNLNMSAHTHRYWGIGVNSIQVYVSHMQKYPRLPLTFLAAAMEQG